MFKRIEILFLFCKNIIKLLLLISDCAIRLTKKSNIYKVQE